MASTPWPGPRIWTVFPLILLLGQPPQSALRGSASGHGEISSVNSGTLYYGNGADLYTLNTSTGAGTLVGAFGSGAEIGALVTVGGILYGGDQGNATIDTINTSTGAATSSQGLPFPTFGELPDPLPAGGGTATPEPGSYAALILAFGGVMLVARSHRAKQRA